jgi:hypothetical protein
VKPHKSYKFALEATTGFEPVIRVLQTLALTTWPRRRAWSGKRDSNPRPSPWQGDALPLRHSRTAERLITDQRTPTILYASAHCQAA